MTFDALAWRRQQIRDAQPLAPERKGYGYLAGLADDCLATAADPKEMQQTYRRRACSGGAMAEVQPPPKELGLDCALPQPLLPGWLALSVAFELQTPWFAKDDRPFHPLDNPVRKDPVFGTPYLSASSWKGLLRWACRMEQEPGLLEHLEAHPGQDLRESGWADDPINRWLFGDEKGVSERCQRGVLNFYPTWFDQIAYEVINPHSRTRRAGTHPIPYEVVPAGTEARLSLLLAPAPGNPPSTASEPERIVSRLLHATRHLLTRYGISAKRTAGWGLARITRWSLQGHGEEPLAVCTNAESPEASVPERIREAALNAIRSEGTP